MLYFFILSSLFFVANPLLFVPKDNAEPFGVMSLVNNYQLQTLSSFEFPDGSSFAIYHSSDESLVDNLDFRSLFSMEEDSVVSIRENSQFVFKSPDELPWHLGRITKRKLPLQNTFPLTTCLNGTNIDTYIVDTGIDISHSEFSGRAKWGANFVDNQDTDCNNHGTHVAGLIGSKTYGVCNDANLFAVKVLDCQGRGSLSGVIKGIEWVYKQHRKKKGNAKSVINMSLGGGYSRAINMAVQKTLQKDNNFYVVVAAGNENSDACDTSPASVQEALTVMASDKSDNRAWFSNWGTCAHIYSPGVDVLSTIPNEGTAVYSGTSMASPITAGALNYLLSRYSDKNMTEIKQIMFKLASKNLVRGSKAGKETPNLLLYVPLLE